MKGAFSLEKLADAAVAGVRDAAEIVKGFQNDEENIKRMDDFIGAPGASQAGNKREVKTNLFAGALSKSKFGKKFGNALGKIKKAEKKEEPVKKARGPRTSSYKFGDGDGYYWDRWLSPSRSAKYALPDHGRASQSYLQPNGGFKRDEKEKEIKRKEEYHVQLNIENKMLDDHIEYAKKNMGHIVRKKLTDINFSVESDNNMNEIQEKNDEKEEAEKNKNQGLSPSGTLDFPSGDRRRGVNSAAKLLPQTSPIRYSQNKKSSSSSNISAIKDYKFYENYREYESKINHEAKLVKHKEKHNMLKRQDSTMHALDPDFNSDAHRTGSMLAFHDEILLEKIENINRPGQLPPMVRNAKPILQCHEENDWMVKLHKSAIDPVKSGLMGVEIRKDLVPEPLISRALSGKHTKMSKLLSKVEVDFEHFGLGDVRTIRLAQSIRSLRDMKMLNLSSNRLTQKSIVAVVDTLIGMGKEGKTELESFKISDNNLGLKGAESIRRMLITQPRIRLITLELSRVGLTDKQCEALVLGLMEVGKSNSGTHSLQKIDVSHNKISSRGGVAFGELLALEGSQCAITELDLSWNVLSGRGAVRLGEALAGEDTLKKLNLAYNSFGKSGALSLGKALETNETLSYLDLTANNVGGQACIVIAYGLSINEALETLIMDLNPIGEAGARSMLRLYAEGEEDTTLFASGCNFRLERPYAKLEPFDKTDPIYVHSTTKKAQDRINLSQEGVEAVFSFDQAEPDAVSEDTNTVDPTLSTLSTVVKNAIEFEPGNPTGTYILDIGKPFERAVAYLILELANKFPGFELGDTIIHKGVDGSTKSIRIGRTPNEDLMKERAQIIDVDSGNKWEVPENGIVTMIVSKNWSTPFPCVGIKDAALERMIIVMYGRKNAPQEERTKMLEMACMDMYFTAAQAIRIVSHIHVFEEMVNASALLLPRILDDGELFREHLSPGVLSQVELKLGQLFHFYPNNPTGRYILNLSKASDHLVMTKLLGINRVDKLYAQYESKHGDTSKHGDWSNFRNGLYSNQAVNLEVLFRNGVPERGKVIVDYVSPRRCPRDSKIINDEQLDQLIHELNFMEEFDDTVLISEFLIPYPKPEPIEKDGKSRKQKSPKNSPKNSPEKSNSDPESPAAERDHKVPDNDEDPEELKKLTFEYKLAESCKRTTELFKRPMTKQLERMVHKMNKLRRFAAEHYLSCEQVAKLVLTIPIQFPTCRVGAIQLLFNRIVNFEHFYVVEDALNSTGEDKYNLQSTMLQERLGLLNILNPNYVDRDFMLRTEIYEDNKVARLLVDYAIAEPGENWANVTRQHNLTRPPMPGWDLNAIFYPETLCKFDGTFVCLTYYSGADEGCRPIWNTRKKWMNQFLVSDGGEYEWDEFDHTDIPLMHKHFPFKPIIGGKDFDEVSALRSRNNNLLLARPEFEKNSNTWHVF
jgi:Ran GTPase-activating protein (RanGAP) involved in mRNA processing and transport